MKNLNEKTLRNYLHTNYPKVRAMIWSDNRHRLTVKKIEFLTGFANEKDDSVLINLIGACI